jgi:hypothetical protein
MPKYEHTLIVMLNSFQGDLAMVACREGKR